MAWEGYTPAYEQSSLKLLAIQPMDGMRGGSISQLVRIRLEVLGLLVVPFLSLAAVGVSRLIRPAWSRLWNMGKGRRVVAVRVQQWH